MADELCLTLPTSKWNIVLTTTLGLLISIIASTTNVLILTAIYKKPSLHTITYYCLASLAVGDLFVGIVALPLWITRSLLSIADEEHPLSVAVDCVYVLSVGTSTFNLCTVSLERYVGVVLPLRYNVNQKTTSVCSNDRMGSFKQYRLPSFGYWWRFLLVGGHIYIIFFPGNNHFLLLRLHFQRSVPTVKSYCSAERVPFTSESNPQQKGVLDHCDSYQCVLFDSLTSFGLFHSWAGLTKANVLWTEKIIRVLGNLGALFCLLECSH